MTENAQKADNKENEGILKKYALVVADVNGMGTKAFSYLIPEDLKDKIKYGSPVVVPFGTKNAVNGFVTGFSDTIDGNYNVKPILDVLDDDVAFTPEYMQLLLWTAKYYICDLNAVLQTACASKLFGKYKTKIIRLCENLPDTISADELKILSLLEYKVYTSDVTLKRKSGFTKEKFSRILRKLKTNGFVKVENLADEQTITEKTQKYIKLLSKNTDNKRYLNIAGILEQYKEISVAEFAKIAKTTPQTLQKMHNDNLVQIFDKKIDRNPLNIYNNQPRTDFPELSEEQKTAYGIIADKIDKHQSEPILIHGVTASGKTELYFALMKKVIESGKNVLFLAPEIALASMLVKKTAQRFGIENVAIWHSSVSDTEKFDIRSKLKRNEIKILVGARSAVFAPLKDIGLIVIDEEHENSYKQTMPPPYYNAVEVAEKLAIINNATVIKGSATPDICSYYRAKESRNLIELKERFNNVPLAPVAIVDMKEEVSDKGQKKLSNYLIRKIEDNLQNKKQTILLMNRLGFSTRIQCQSCGEILTCPHCSVPMVYHKNQNSFKCHWCDFEMKTTDRCPSCNSDTLKFSGMGTERAEDIVQKIFPEAKIARFDSENLKLKNAHAKILNDFENGEIDILIGTQLSAKGLDNENVTLVGVINSDNSFVFPDYRSMERGFQLLTQVAGRAGRGKFGGEVVFQTFNPDFSPIRTAKEQDYKKFYEEEIKLRKEFRYPPFSQIIRFIVSGTDEKRAKQAMDEIREHLKKILLKKDYQNKFEVSPASSCAIEKINNDYRYEILVKNFAQKQGLAFIARFYRNINLPKDLKIKIDVNPIDLI
ncbi:MAG: primosomal protein N' [Candidatus Gastranaerophilales bacterium]|nr:primosomal protein N' [Candidatus Gastranaerophilales bacterium]